MKRSLVLLLIVALFLGLAGCGEKKVAVDPQEEEEPIGTTQIANPYVEKSIEEFNEFGIAMQPFEGATNMVYYIVGEEFAQINFEMNEVAYTFRGQKDTTFEDLCGIYGDLIASNRDGKASYYKYEDENGKTSLATWTVDDITYVVSTEDSEEVLSQYVEAYLN